MFGIMRKENLYTAIPKKKALIIFCTNLAGSQHCTGNDIDSYHRSEFVLVSMNLDETFVWFYEKKNVIESFLFSAAIASFHLLCFDCHYMVYWPQASTT